jgi:hypothetical protein
MPHLFPIFSVAVKTIAFPTATWIIGYAPTKRTPAYKLDPQGNPGAFELLE